MIVQALTWQVFFPKEILDLAKYFCKITHFVTLGFVDTGELFLYDLYFIKDKL